LRGIIFLLGWNTNFTKTTPISKISDDSNFTGVKMATHRTQTVAFKNALSGGVARSNLPQSNPQEDAVRLNVLLTYMTPEVDLVCIEVYNSLTIFDNLILFIW
jgi:hypothetical protein